MSQSFYTDPELCKRLHHGRGEGMKAYIYFFQVGVAVHQGAAVLLMVPLMPTDEGVSGLDGLQCPSWL